MKLKKKYQLLLVIRWPVGGIRTFIRYVYKTFDSQRYSITIIAPDLPELKLLLNDLDGFNVTCILVDKNPTNKKFYITILKTLNLCKFDVIHSHGFTAAVFSVLASFLFQTPHIVTLHEILNDNQFLGMRGKCKKIMLSVLLPLVDYIHLVSNDARNNLLRHIKVLRLFQSKLVVIPNGIEIDRFKKENKCNLRKELALEDNSFLIGFFGRFMPAKGFDYLIDAIDILYKKISLPKRPIVVAFGEGAYIREEKQYVIQKHLEKFVFFMPFVHDVSSFLKGMDVVAIPSLWETCPILPMEAMVSGVPIIATNCIGLREVISNTPARVVPPRDSKALANSILQEMKLPSRERMKVFSKRAEEMFNVNKYSSQIENLINDLANRK